MGDQPMTSKVGRGHAGTPLRQGQDLHTIGWRLRRLLVDTRGQSGDSIRRRTEEVPARREKIQDESARFQPDERILASVERNSSTASNGTTGASRSRCLLRAPGCGHRPTCAPAMANGALPATVPRIALHPYLARASATAKSCRAGDRAPCLHLPAALCSLHHPCGRAAALAFKADGRTSTSPATNSTRLK